MRRPASSWLLALLTSLASADPKEVGSLTIDGVPDIPAALSERLNQYQNTRSVSLFFEEYLLR